MQPENCNKEFCCRLCLNFTTYINSEIITKAIKAVLVDVFSNLNLEEGHSYQICKPCHSKLVAAFNFKTTCMDTEDIIFAYFGTDEASEIELKEVYHKVNGNIELTDIQENQRICRLCLQLVTYGYLSLNVVDNEIIDTYIPRVDVTATKDPVVCRSCFDSLLTYGGFVRKCLEAQKKYKTADSQLYIKTEEVEVKLEDDNNASQSYKNIDESYIKCEEIEIKSEEGDPDNDPISHNLAEETIENIGGTKDEYMLKCETKVEINKCKTLLSTSSCKNRYKRMLEDELESKIVKKQQPFSEIEMYKCDYETKDKGTLKIHQLIQQDSSEIQMYKCDTCTFETKYKNNLKTHYLLHKDSSEIQMYKCDTCTFETKYKNHLKTHYLSHKDPSDIRLYKCDTCTFETKYKAHLKRHQLTHMYPSETRMYKCNACNYKTKIKYTLNLHQLTHKDPSETQMYRCNECDYESKHKANLKRHLLTHKDPSEIKMYKCDACDYEAKHKRNLKSHLLTHKDPSEIKMYRCDACDYETKHKRALKCHQLTHKNPSEIQMYRCDACHYETKRKGYLKYHLLTHKDLCVT